MSLIRMDTGMKLARLHLCAPTEYHQGDWKWDSPFYPQKLNSEILVS